MAPITTPTTAQAVERTSDMDFTTIPPGCLPEGTETPKGVIEAVSNTAYMISGYWYPFHVIHGRPKPVTPLAVAAGLLEAVEPFRAEMNEANRRNIEIMLGAAK